MRDAERWLFSRDPEAQRAGARCNLRHRGLTEQRCIRIEEAVGERLGCWVRNMRCWIAFSSKPKGIIKIDDGAVKALLKNGKSLLPSGIVSVQDDFGVGAAVEFQNRNNETLGIGLVNYSSTEIQKIMGLKSNHIKQVLGHKSYDEVIHRDNLAITAGSDV